MRKISYILACVSCALAFSGCSGPANPVSSGSLPVIFPDYEGVTIPRSVAPLNFRVEGAERCIVSVSGNRSPKEGLKAKGRGKVSFGITKWRRMLEMSDSLIFKVVAYEGGRWIEYSPFTVCISDDPISPYLCYRRINPGYEKYGKMGIYQRRLSDFTETALIENTLKDGTCINCHSFSGGNPDRMQLHVRGNGGGTLIKNGDRMEFLNTKTPETPASCVYPYWHPGGRFIAYSINQIRQTFLNRPEEVLEVCDLESDVAIYDTESCTLLLDSALMRKDRFETFPAFSADGHTLFYCAADSADVRNFREIRYKLYSVGFDPETGGAVGEPAMIYDGGGQSVSFPRPSWDGRYLMFTRSSFGNFSIWHKDADLWMMDLSSGEVFPAAGLNSDDTESYHSWDFSSRWVVFSSRRVDGLHTRLFIAHSDGNGHFSKPFMLPDADPDHCVMLMQSYNIPEFVKGKASLPARKVIGMKPKNINSKKI